MGDLKIQEPRELVGRMVRQVWVEWAREQPDPKSSWLLPWEDLDDGQREVDMRIGEALFMAGRRAGIEAMSGTCICGTPDHVTQVTSTPHTGEHP